MNCTYPDTRLNDYGLEVRGGALQVSKEFGVRYSLEGYLTRVQDEEIARYAHERSCRTLAAIADYFLAAALGETRHWPDKTWASAFRWYERNNNLVTRFGPLYDMAHMPSDRDHASEYLWDHLHGSPAEVALLVEEFFNHTPWNGCFGGPSWAYIAKFASYLYGLPTQYPQDYYSVLSAFDQVAHITHTGCSVMLRPKFSWFNTYYLGPIVLLAAEGDICCWIYNTAHVWGPYSDKTNAMSTIQADIPPEFMKRIKKYIKENKFARKGHSCFDTHQAIDHGMPRKPEEQEIYIKEHPPLPPHDSEYGICFECGERFSRSLKRCPNYCKVCKQCFAPKHKNHCHLCKMPDVNTFHLEECEKVREALKKEKEEKANEPKVDLHAQGEDATGTCG